MFRYIDQFPVPIICPVFYISYFVQGRLVVEVHVPNRFSPDDDRWIGCSQVGKSTNAQH